MRILVVEDERRIARFIQRGLEERHHTVDVAGDGDEALLLARTNRYDLIVLDLLLPRRDGMAVCQELRAGGERAPILMLTARDTVPDRVAGLNAGADDYLTKPFAFDEFIARVNALARRRNLDCIPTIRVADLELDPLRHEVRRAGRMIELTNKEYALLALLLQRPGQVFTRTQIAEGVWGLNFDSESNVIEVYVRSLRRKIDTGHERPLLYTVRGVGYAVRGDR
jgi:DNA-binding response OmpR family regulator